MGRDHSPSLPQVIRLALICSIVGVATYSTLAYADVTAESRIKSAEVFNGIIDFLITIAIALFALFGFCFKDGFLAWPSRGLQILVGLAFLSSSILSLVLAYFGKLDAMGLLGGAAGSIGFEYSNLRYYYSFQAFFVLISGILAFVAASWAVHAKGCRPDPERKAGGR